MPTLAVASLPAGDAGRLLVRLNIAHRGGVPRYGIAKLTNLTTGVGRCVLVLGHDDPTKIFMPYDIRSALGIERDDQFTFSVAPVRMWGKLAWYAGSIDPAVSIPAWLSIIGLGAGVAGLVAAIIPLIIR